jgi:hypothetical protein
VKVEKIRIAMLQYLLELVPKRGRYRTLPLSAPDERGGNG